MFLICMLMPASISIFTDRKINGREKNTSDLILKYLFYTFLITTIMNTFIYLFSSEKMLHYAEYTFSYDFCLKYMWLSIVVAFLLPYILKIISANISINLEISKKKRSRSNEKNKEVSEKKKEVKKTAKKENNKSN